MRCMFIKAINELKLIQNNSTLSQKLEKSGFQVYYKFTVNA